MVWKKEYNTGIQEIDLQHQELFQIVSKLQGSLSTDAKYGEIGPTLKFLVNYTKEHFDSEERIMSKIDYPEFHIHQQHHKKLIDEINGVLHKLKNHQSYTAIELYYLLTNWLMEHILNEDIKISRYYYNKVGKQMPSHLGTGSIDQAGSADKKPLIASSIEQIYNKSIGEDKSSLEIKKECIAKITTYYKGNPVQPLENIKDVFSNLDAMNENALIETDSIKEFKMAIYTAFDFRSTLNQATSIESKLNYIKYLYQQGVFDEIEYEKLKIEEVRQF